jgi:hypothetical protein
MQFLVDNSMYVTLIVAALILIGLLAYLSRIDARLRRVERHDPQATSNRSE